MKSCFNFRAWLAAAALLAAAGPTQAGSIARLVYDGITGTTVSTLTNATIFPDGPTFREQLDDFSPTAAGALRTGLQSKENTGNNFGAYVRGYLEAPATGEYVFYIASDDASELWLGTDHTPASRKRLAFESGAGAPLFSGPRLNERQSGPVNLARGRKYWIEVLHKQGTGASYIQVGWQRPDGAQEIIPARHLAQHPVDPYLGRLEPNLPPAVNPEGRNGGDLPATLAANEGDDVLLELDVIAAQPTTIEWRRNGVAIPGENLSFLKLSRVSASANGQTIQAFVSNAFGQLTSASAKLAITADTTAPAISAVDHRGNPNQLTVAFSEPVAPATATNLANYELKSAAGTVLAIQSAILLADTRTVQLAGNFNFTVNGQYQLTTRNVEDQAATPNRLAPNPTTTPFSYAGEFVGPVGFAATNPLHDLVVVENRVARFEAFLTGAKPWFYQWSRNGAVIPGATNSVLEVIANAANAGNFQVAVSNAFSAATSPVARLTITPDTAPPRIASLRGLAGVNTVRLQFDEPLAPAAATNAANYSLASVPVLGATQSADGRTVTLLTGPLQRGQIYLLSVIGLADTSVAGNTLATSASFVAEVDYAGEVLADAPVRYWRFAETSGASVASQTGGVDAVSAGLSALQGSPVLGVPGLVPSDRDGVAIQFSAASSQRITVPNGSDLNANVGPWAKKSFEFWFRATTAPAPDSTGLAATAGIWEQGAATRNIAVYLWRDPSKPNPNEAELVFHAFNNATDGPGAPFGLTTLPAVFVQHTVKVGQTYHVIAVFDGDKTGLTGNLILYVNGEEVGRAGGVGQIYNHTGDVQIGRGNGIIHTGENGDLGFFNGVLDEVSAYNSALTPARVTAHYQAGLGGSDSQTTPPALAKVETRGNPGAALVTFTRPVTSATAANVQNYTLKTASGTVLPLASAALLPGDLTVQLTGAFNFQAGGNYTLTARDILDQASPANTLTPNPATATFTFSTSGAVSIGATSELASRKAFENEPVRFAVVPAGAGPFSYQWFRNGVALPGADKAELLVIATTATVGAYTVKVSNDFSQITSAAANLSLDVDFLAPQLVSLRALGGSINEVRLQFDEAVDVTSGGNPATYNIASVSVLSATVSASGKEVTLRTSPLENGKILSLAITGLKDPSTAGNALATSVTFAAATSYTDEVLADNPVRYWHLDETTGVTATTLTAKLDTTASAVATLVNAPTLGVPGLVSNLVGNPAIRLTAANSQRLTVPNGSDLNATAGPWAKKTVQFWFRAASVPAPDTTGLAATAGLWEQGAATRSLAVYLWRDPAKPAADEAELVFNALNNAADGAGAPFGPPGNPAIFVQTTIKVGKTYHVVAVFDGDATGLNGKLVLYVNGVEAGQAPGAGQLYNHTGDVQIGRGNGLTHNNDNGDWGFFDGVIDEVAVYNTALTAQRASQLYQFGNTVPPAFAGIDNAASELGDRVVLAGQTVRFAVTATGSGPFTYQWQQDGVTLAAETNRVLEFTASAATAGRYSVKVSNAFSTLTSAPALLSVQTQSLPPELASTTAVAGTVNEVRLTFTRPLDATSATNAANYSAGSLNILNVLLSADGKTVTLRTSAQTPGQAITVNIQGVRDRATPEGVLNSVANAASRLSYPDEVLADGPVRYFRFEETSGTNAASQVSILDILATTPAALYASPTLGVPGLVPNEAGGKALQFAASSSNRVVVPNGSDINITTGPWAKRSLSFWFKATTLPRGGASPQAPVLFEEGGDSRGLALYLYGTQDTATPAEALLVWNAYNNAADGVSGGWGVALGNITKAVFVTTPVRANEVYHVVAVLDGDSQGKAGSIQLYVNGQLAGSAPGAGQIFNHSADIQLGRGAFVRHDGITAGNLHYYDGVLDELAIYNRVISAARAAQLYQIGLGETSTPGQPRITGIKSQGGNIVITWEGAGRLAAASTVDGTYAPVTGSDNPHAEPIPATGQRFFRVIP